MGDETKKGGHIPSPDWGIVGEQGPEIFKPSIKFDGQRLIHKAEVPVTKYTLIDCPPMVVQDEDDEPNEKLKALFREPEVKPMENPGIIQIPNPYPNQAWSVEIDKRKQRIRMPREFEDENFVRIVVEPLED